MTCREEILVAANLLKDLRPDGTFGVDELLDVLRAHGSGYLDITIWICVTTQLCRDAEHDGAVYHPALERVATNAYRLR